MDSNKGTGVKEASTSAARRLRRVMFSPYALLQWVTTSNLKVTCVKGVPEGANVVGCHVDPLTNSVHLIVEHASFDLIIPGQIIPEFVTLFSTKPCEPAPEVPLCPKCGDPDQVRTIEADTIKNGKQVKISAWICPVCDYIFER